MQPQQATYQQPAANPAFEQPAPAVQAAPAAPAVQAAPAAQAVPQTTGNKQYPWLRGGENVRMEVKGLLGFSASNPIVRIMVSLMLTIMAICGFRQKATMVVTNQRLVIDTRAYALWVVEKGSDAITIFRADDIVTGYNSSLLIFKKRYIEVGGYQIGVNRNHTQADLENMSVMIQEVLN